MGAFGLLGFGLGNHCKGNRQLQAVGKLQQPGDAKACYLAPKQQTRIRLMNL